MMTSLTMNGAKKMSSRLRMSLVAGIATLQTHEGRIIDARYTGSPLWRLEEPEWQELPVTPPSYEGPYPVHGDREYAMWRSEFIQECLLNRRGSPAGRIPQAYEVLFYDPKQFPQLLGFRVQDMPDIDLLGFALATLEEKYTKPGYQALPTYQGSYRYVSSMVPPDIQALQRDEWAYTSFSDRMPGYFYTFQYLCDCLGFKLLPEDYAQVKLYLCWYWG